MWLQGITVNPFINRDHSDHRTMTRYSYFHRLDSECRSRYGEKTANDSIVKLHSAKPQLSIPGQQCFTMTPPPFHILCWLFRSHGGRAFVGFIESFLKADRVSAKANSSSFWSIFKSPFTSASSWKLPNPHLTKEVQNKAKSPKRKKKKDLWRHSRSPLTCNNEYFSRSL